MDTAWSPLMGGHVKVSVLDKERGYLYLLDDPKSWNESNQNKLLLVRKLELHLTGKRRLEHIQESSIDELKELTHLYILSGQYLKFLPNSITKLHKLQVLEIGDCILIKELPKNLGYLKNLTHLKLDLCRELVELPASIGQLKNLTHLKLSNCRELVKLPASMGQLDNLTHLSLSNCRELVELPASMGQLKNLTHVSLIGCSKIKSLSNVMEVLLKLVILEIINCSSLIEVPPNASRITLNRRSKESIEAWYSIVVKATYKDDTVKFNFFRTSTIDELRQKVGQRFEFELSNFKMYRVAENDLLLLTSNDELGDISIAPNSNTVEVHVFDDDEGYLCWWDDPSKWTESNRAKRLSVRKLKLDFSKRGLKEIGDSIVELEELTHLYISGGDNLYCLPNSITRLHKLKVLEICCFSLKELPENLGDLKCLTHLSLEFCLNITNLPESLGQLKSLTHLSLNLCVELAELPESLGQLKNLTHVSLFGCSKIQSLSNVMKTLENLESLEISICSSIKDLPPNAFEDEKERIEIPPEVIMLLIGKNTWQWKII